MCQFLENVQLLHAQIMHSMAIYPYSPSAKFSLILELRELIIDLTPFANKPWFLRVCSTSLLKTLWEKEKLLVTSNFSFSHSVFYPFRELSTIFINFKIVVCKLFLLGESKICRLGKG